MTDNQREKFIIGLIFMVVILIYLYFYNLSLRSGWLLIGGLIIIALSFIMLKSRKFLIFSTALFLMLTATQFGTIKSVMETLRWIPYIVFVFLFFSQLFIKKKLPRNIEGFDIVLLIIIVLMFLSAFYSIDPLMTVKRAGTFLLLYISVFWIIYPEIQSKEDAEGVIDLILYASLIPFTIMVILLFFPLISFRADRFIGYFLNANTIGVLSAILLPLLLWKSIDKESRWARILLIFVLVSLFLSSSRSGLIGSFIGGSFYLFMTKKKYSIPMIFLGLTFIIIMFITGDKITGAVASYMRLGPLGGVGGERGINVISSGRIEKWKTMISLIKEKPFIGYGFGTEDLLFRHYGIFFEEPGLYAHNTFLGMAVQMGIPVFTLFFFPIFYLLFKPNKKQDALIYALTGMMIGGLLVGFFESWIYSVGNAFAFSFWVGVVILWRLKRE